MIHSLSKTKSLQFFVRAIAFGIGLLLLCLIPSPKEKAEAASLSVTPTSAKVSVGNIVSLRVLVGTNGKSINSADGTIIFPSDLLEVLSISKNPSIFSLWVEDPKFSNSDGTITYGGGLPNPGFTGEDGTVFTVVFKAKKQGVASLVFTDASVRENDGSGTDILSVKVPGTITIGPASQDIQSTVAAGTPAAPTITSSTHPDQNAWYSNPDVSLQWDVPNDVTAVSTLVGQMINVTPTVVYDPPIGNKKLPRLEDGVWYFHVRFKNQNGWGKTAHYRIRIDTTAPNSFTVAFPDGAVSENPNPRIQVKAIDTVSGIDHYEAKVGGGSYEPLILQQGTTDIYTLPTQQPGAHSLLVKAVDLAGNATSEIANFTVTSINPPQIEDYTSSLDEGSPLKVRGTTYPLASVDIVLHDASGKNVTETVSADNEGLFATVWPHDLKHGSYTLTARATDQYGAHSPYTKPLTITVYKYSVFNLGSLTLNWLTLILIIVLALGNFGFVVFYFVERIAKMKKAVGRKVKAAESSVHKAFNLLRENTRDQIETLEKARGERALTKEEEKVIRELQANLSKSEQYLERQISDINRY